MASQKRSVGRPGVTNEKWNKAVALFAQGFSPQRVATEIGINLQKAYEIKRNPILKSETA